MKLSYDQEIDSLYIDLNERPSADSREIQDGVVIDVDAQGRIVGIDIQHASEVLDLATLETQSLPAARLKLTWLGESQIRPGFAGRASPKRPRGS
jgi:uncharacterized protein YuzE